MRRFAPLVLLLALVACDPPASESAAADPADTMTRRQKDELLSTMPVPGSRAVGRALGAADAAQARADQLDSMRD